MELNNKAAAKHIEDLNNYSRFILCEKLKLLHLLIRRCSKINSCVDSEAYSKSKQSFPYAPNINRPEQQNNQANKKKLNKPVLAKLMPNILWCAAAKFLHS
jgi:hypothetical protein